MNYTAEYPLQHNGISKSLAFIEETLSKYRLKPRDLMEAVLISEEAILMLEEKAPEDAHIKITITRRMGVPRVKIMMPGDALQMDEHIGTVSLDQLGDKTENAIRSIMLRSYSDSIKYRNSHSGNSMTITTGIPERILATYTILAIVLAAVTGYLMISCLPNSSTEWLLLNVFEPIETLFVSALMCIAAPAVFVSITCSMFRFEGFSELGRNSKLVIFNYLLTSVMATLIGYCCFRLLIPGEAGIFASEVISGTSDKFSIASVLTTMVPSNIIEPFINVNSLQLMFTAIVIGTAMTASGRRVGNVKTLFEELDVLCGKISSFIMKVVPLAVYCSIVNFILSSKTDALLSAVELVLTIFIGFVVILVVHCLILVGVARLNPITFIKKYAPFMKSTFLKGSGVAAIPINIRACRRKFGVPQSICSFSIPLGATINMDGNCICLTVSTLFFAHICGVPLDMNALLIMFFLVIVLSLGAPIAPGTLILCLVTLLSQIGIDTNVISLIIGINFILEMIIGVVNSMGDVIVALIVARREGSLDMDIYNKE